MTRDLVCGMNVDEKTTPHKSTYENREYAFCGAGCKATFDKHPEKYALSLARQTTSRSPTERDRQ